ncbi:hypothetical protein ACEQ8H_007073 [Pleosporales sp. CAS-2024a]
MPPIAPLNLGVLPPAALLLPSSIRSLIPAQPSLSTPSYICIRTIKSTNKPRPNRFNHRPGKPALNSTSTAALERKAHSTPLRTGVLALKRGMTAMYNPTTGARTACTVLQLDRNVVVAHKTRDKNGYWAVQMGAGQKEARNVTKPMLGHFAKAETAPKRWVAEFKVRGEEGLGVRVGQSVGAGWFEEGGWVDGMKRHGFSGQPASHGQSLMHRGMGSAGASQGSGSRVLPGKRMAGNMGNESVTVKNLRIMQVDEKNGILVVNGCVPGPKNQLIKVQDALGKPWPKGPMKVADEQMETGAVAAAVVAAETPAATA